MMTEYNVKDVIDISKEANEKESNAKEKKEVNEKKETKEKTQLKISRFLSLASKLHLQRIVNPSSLYKYAYVLLDTSNAASELSSSTSFGWNIINFVSLQTGTISIIGQVRDIVGMRLYPVTGTFNIPINVPGKEWFNLVVNLNYNFTILIKEFQAQSYAAHNGVKFHFNLFPYIMNYLYDNSGHPYTPPNPYIEYVTSGKGNGWFWFKTPITLANTLTVQLGDPFNIVTQVNNTRTLIPLQLIYLDSNDN